MQHKQIILLKNQFKTNSEYVLWNNLQLAKKTIENLQNNNAFLQKNLEYVMKLLKLFKESNKQVESNT